MNTVVEESRRHLADLIEACQRCAWHLQPSAAEDWQACRSLRNRAAHDYGTDLVITAEHFNALHAHIPILKTVTLTLADYAMRVLGIEPTDSRFAAALRQR